MACSAAHWNLLNLKEKNLVILGAASHRINVAAEDECTQTVDSGDVIGATSSGLSVFDDPL
jgi:hypothetical protein